MFSRLIMECIQRRSIILLPISFKLMVLIYFKNLLQNTAFGWLLCNTVTTIEPFVLVFGMHLLFAHHLQCFCLLS